MAHNPEVWIAIAILWGLIQFLAFLEGSDVLYGFSGIGGGFSFILVSFVPLFGPLYITYVGFVGATRGWKWPIWLSLLIIAPGLIVYTIFMVALVVNLIADKLG